MDTAATSNDTIDTTDAAAGDITTAKGIDYDADAKAAAAAVSEPPRAMA